MVHCVMLQSSYKLWDLVYLWKITESQDVIYKQDDRFYLSVSAHDIKWNINRCADIDNTKTLASKEGQTNKQTEFYR